MKLTFENKKNIHAALCAHSCKVKADHPAISKKFANSCVDSAKESSFVQQGYDFLAKREITIISAFLTGTGEKKSWL